MDEYERTARDLRSLVGSIDDAAFVRIADAQTADEDCRSAQTVMRHVVGSGYGYADYLRAIWNVPSTRPERTLTDRAGSIAALDAMLAYTVESLKDHWTMTPEEMDTIKILTRWEVVYTVDQLLEHAVCHILRHRRQIEKFMATIGAA